jgi:major membrane immunogen (membrane-anchored lipoprotein)
MKYLTMMSVMLLLVGCYESTDVTLHEAGIYKGKNDRHDLSSDERAIVLEKRFKQVQTDR